MYDIMSDKLEQVQKEYMENINKALNTIMDKLQINPNEEIMRRFKNFMVVDCGNSSTYYYNDGSLNGLAVMTITRDNIVKEENKNGATSFSINSYIIFSILI